MATLGTKGIRNLHKWKKRKKPNKFKKLVDFIAYFVAILGPLIAIPQLWKIWSFQDATGVSILTWTGYMTGGIFWFTYGLLHKEKPLMIMNLLWLIFALFIVIGILRFG